MPGRPAKISDELRDFVDIHNALSELLESKLLTRRIRRAIFTALKGFVYACDPARMEDFNSYLLNWPGTLTDAEEQRLVQLGLERDSHPTRKKRSR